jgi:hypothetical protein
VASSNNEQQTPKKINKKFNLKWETTINHASFSETPKKEAVIKGNLGVEEK